MAKHLTVKGSVNKHAEKPCAINPEEPKETPPAVLAAECLSQRLVSILERASRIDVQLSGSGPPVNGGCDGPAAPTHSLRGTLENCLTCVGAIESVLACVEVGLGGRNCDKDD